MSYIEKSLGEGEQIQGLFHFHWFEGVGFLFYYVPLPLIVMVGVAADGHGLLSVVLAIPLFALAVFAHLRYRMTEMACTNRRVILKTGIVGRKTEEIIIKRIETIEIGESVLGRLLGYGSVEISGTGASALTLGRVRDPLGVKKMIEAAAAMHPAVSE